MPNLINQLITKELDASLAGAEGMILVSMKGLSVAESGSAHRPPQAVRFIIGLECTMPVHRGDQPTRLDARGRDSQGRCDVAVGTQILGEGIIYSSNNLAVSSTLVLVLEPSSWLKGLAYGNGTFVAAGDDDFIMTSTDAAVWTSLTSGTGTFFEGVAFGNGTFVAVGNGGTIMTSSTGAVWTTFTKTAQCVPLA